MFHYHNENYLEGVRTRPTYEIIINLFKEIITVGNGIIAKVRALYWTVLARILSSTFYHHVV